uniref:beta-N-acetylhexosaminidase n=1 Tax=Macrostomum lignano TaxID=282301 RepID=A0A1I8IP26_9PLAT
MNLRLLLARTPCPGCYYSRFAIRVGSAAAAVLCLLFIVSSVYYNRPAAYSSGGANSILRSALQPAQLADKLQNAQFDTGSRVGGDRLPAVGGGADELHRLAQHLRLVYAVTANTDSGGGSHSVVIRLGNPFKTRLGAGIRWRMYFSLMHPVVQHQTGGGCGRKLQFLFKHVNGYLHYLEPTGEAAADGLPPGDDCLIEYTGNGHIIGRYDAFPNWYLVPLMPPSYEAESPQAVVVECTAGLANQFVAPLLTPAQFKRGQADAHSPWTPEERERRRLAYLGGREAPAPSKSAPPPRLVPAPIHVQPLPPGQLGLPLAGLLLAARIRSEVGCDSAELTLAYLEERRKALSPASSAAAEPIDISLCARPEEASLTAALASTKQPALLQFQRRWAYLLRFHPTRRRLELRAFAPEGLFAAAQTLLALLHDPGPPLSVRSVLDYPRFEYRGLMLDVARNMQPLAVLLKILDVMAMYKLNKLHLHLSDDEGLRLPITDAFKLASRRCHDPSGKLCLPPQLGSHPTDGRPPGVGYYSSTEYAQLLKYAADRFIEVIPEVDMPAHAHSLIAAHRHRAQLTDPGDPSRPVSVQNYFNNSLNPCMPDTQQLVRRVVSDLVRLHSLAGVPLSTFNFGGDEPPGDAWQASPACQRLGLGSRDSINRLFLRTVAEQAGRHGLSLMGWEDGYVVKDSDKRPYNLTEVLATADRRPNGSLVLSWLNQMAWGSGDLAYKFANQGYKVVLAHATHLYLDHQQEPDPEERGLYWATRFIDLRKAFSYDAADIYANMREDIMGQPVDVKATCSQRGGCASLHQPGNIIGLSGALWGETLQAEQLALPMLLPRLLAVAERAWHRASWEAAKDPPALRDALLAADWAAFVDAVSRRELSRLSRLRIPFSLPPPAALRSPASGRVRLSHQMPHNVRLLYAFAGSGRGEHWEEAARHGDEVAVPDGAVRMLLKAGFGDPGNRHESYIESRTVQLPLTASSASGQLLREPGRPPSANGVEGAAKSTALRWLLLLLLAAAAVGLACLACCWASLPPKGS